MEYIVIFFAFTLCWLTACCIMKIKLKVFVKIIINSVSLLVFGTFMVVSGLRETALLTYIILLVITLFGMLMRAISPIMLNLAAMLVAKMTKQDYEWLKYDQLMELEQSGYKMYFCVLIFTTLKVALYLILVISSIGLV